MSETPALRIPDDVPARPRTPLVPGWTFCGFAGMDVRRAPAAWAKRPLGEVVDGIGAGGQRELQA